MARAVKCFFQRHVTDGMSSHVHGVKVAGHGEGKAYIYINDAEGLISLVQMGTIELHAWNATVDDVKSPDRLIFDLDPAPDVPWEAVKSAARNVRTNLKMFGLVSFLKTTGGKGLHVVVPFARGPAGRKPSSSRGPSRMPWQRTSRTVSRSTAVRMCGKGVSSSTISATTKRRVPSPPIPCAPSGRAGIDADRLAGVVFAQEWRCFQHQGCAETPCRSVEGHRQGGRPAPAPRHKGAFGGSLTELSAEPRLPRCITAQPGELPSALSGSPTLHPKPEALD